MKPIPLDEQIACVKREIAMRRNIYPKRVAAGKMPQIQADYEIERMEAVLETLQNLKQPDSVAAALKTAAAFRIGDTKIQPSDIGQ